MKRTLLCLLSTGMVCAALVTNGFTQQRPVAPAATGAAPAATTAQTASLPFVTVDLEMLMKRHPNLYVQREAFQEQQKKLQADIQQRQLQLQNEAKELTNLTPGTPGFTQKKDELVRKEANLKADVMNYEEQLRSHEVRVMYSVYSDLKYYIEAVAKQYGALVVIPYIQASTIIKPSTGEKSLQDMATENQLLMAQNLVYADPRINITEAVQAQIDAKYANVGKVTVDPQTLEAKFQKIGGGTSPVATPGVPQQR